MSCTTFAVFVSFAVYFTVNINGYEVDDRTRPCRLNEIEDYCGILCEDRCNAVRPEYCAGKVQCGYTGCRCKDGFSRNPYTNECVENEQCPVDGCARGEIRATCGRACEGTCSNSIPPAKCLTMQCLDWECRCDRQAGFVRNLVTGKCTRLGEPCNKLEDYKGYNNGLAKN